MVRKPRFPLLPMKPVQWATNPQTVKAAAKIGIHYNRV
jgi:hypothetical protein